MLCTFHSAFFSDSSRVLQVDGVSLPVLWGVRTVSCSPVLLPRSLQSGGEGRWGGGSSLGGRSPHHRPLSGQPHQTVHVDLMCNTENAVALYVHIHTLLHFCSLRGCVCVVVYSTNYTWTIFESYYIQGKGVYVCSSFQVCECELF